MTPETKAKLLRRPRMDVLSPLGLLCFGIPITLDEFAKANLKHGTKAILVDKNGCPIIAFIVVNEGGKYFMANPKKYVFKVKWLGGEDYSINEKDYNYLVEMGLPPEKITIIGPGKDFGTLQFRKIKKECDKKRNG